jgi:hypothetical protein
MTICFVCNDVGNKIGGRVSVDMGVDRDFSLCCACVCLCQGVLRESKFGQDREITVTLQRAFSLGEIPRYFPVDGVRA